MGVIMEGTQKRGKKRTFLCRLQPAHVKETLKILSRQAIYSRWGGGERGVEGRTVYGDW